MPTYHPMETESSTFFRIGKTMRLNSTKRHNAVQARFDVANYAADCTGDVAGPPLQKQTIQHTIRVKNKAVTITSHLWSVNGVRRELGIYFVLSQSTASLAQPKSTN